VAGTSGSTVRGERFDELRLDGVSRSFGGRPALRELALTIHAGEFVALLGPSGCGKSTALNCLAGLLPLSGGSIWLDGRRIDGVPPEQRGFGMVFQSYALFPHMSVRRNVGFGLSIRHVPRAEARERVDEALRLVELTEHADKLPGQLSGGQQQRVAIARAIVIRPRLVLMDEPLSNLDAKLRLEMRAEIKRLHQGLGLTSIYVTHDQAEALSLSDRIVVMREGRVMQVGAPADIHDRPRNRFVADFVGYRNVIPLTVTARGVDGMVTAEGAGLRVRGRSDVGPGGAVLAAVRPEDLRLTDDAGAASVARGTVRLVEYQGREYDVEVALESGAVLEARLPTAPKVGAGVGLFVEPGRVVLLPAEEGA
jgi:putative spermidine/putrescine transport system ATP-binding protein